MASPPLPTLLPAAMSAAKPSAGRGSDDVSFPPPIVIRSVRAGAWLVNYQPANSVLVAFDGTIRVESNATGRTASGDLYQRQVIFLPDIPPLTGGPILAPPPSPANGIPILSRSRYRYYLRITEILESVTFSNSFDLGFQMWRFNGSSGTWALEGNFSASMTWITAPFGYPSARDYLEGDVKAEATGSVVGRLKMGWLSSSFRKVTVEIDTVPTSERPLDSGDGHNWATVFSTLGWDIDVVQSDTDVAEASGTSWSDVEMHAAMLARRDRNNLDIEWRYHILAVKLIDSTERGIMYDSGATDSDNVPREGVGIASDWIVPSTGVPDWGLVKGLRFGTAKAPYFRTAVHELGHAFGLLHNFVDLGFMNTSDTIAGAGTPANPFPSNIKWNYADDDLKRLRHYPDVFVRPGGVAFGLANESTPTISPTDQEIEMPGLTLSVKPLLGEVPLGAPVRVNVTLTNNGDSLIQTPGDISLKSNFVRGTVKDFSGTSRTFSPLVLCVDEHRMVELKKGDSITASLTLLRGAEGALFPTTGVSEISVQARWRVNRGFAEEIVVAGKTTVFITPASTPSHAAAAHRVLTTPDAHLVLILGGHHLKKGIKAIKQATEDQILGPHFAAVEAKRLMQAFQDQKPDVNKAAKLLEGDDVVMSTPEALKLNRLFKQVGAGKDPAGVARVLKVSGASGSNESLE